MREPFEAKPVTTVTFQLDSDLAQTLRQIRQEAGITQRKIITEAIRKYLEEMKNGRK